MSTFPAAEERYFAIGTIFAVTIFAVSQRAFTFLAKSHGTVFTIDCMSRWIFGVLGEPSGGRWVS
jgi:hypothetical protein